MKEILNTEGDLEQSQLIEFVADLRADRKAMAKTLNKDEAKKIKPTSKVDLILDLYYVILVKIMIGLVAMLVFVSLFLAFL